MSRYSEHAKALVQRSRASIDRQVQIGAGIMALLGTGLGLLVSPWFYIVPAWVGAGLIIAGVTGFCGMARLLKHAPWNRCAAHAAAGPQ